MRKPHSRIIPLEVNSIIAYCRDCGTKVRRTYSDMVAVCFGCKRDRRRKKYIKRKVGNDKWSALKK